MDDDVVDVDEFRGFFNQETMTHADRGICRHTYRTNDASESAPEEGVPGLEFYSRQRQEECVLTRRLTEGRRKKNVRRCIRAVEAGAVAHTAG